MGSTTYSSVAYTTRSTAKADAGIPTFDHDDYLRRSVPRSAWTAHDILNPKGVKVRESRDSDAHPTAKPIAVFLDVTGSMGTVVHAIHAKLPELYGVLMRGAYVEHPAILFGAVGDAYSDRVPLQVGQFESGNEADEAVEKIVIERGGGAGESESYELAAYFMARHTVTDEWEKRGGKGYLFIVGDEQNYPKVSRRQVEEVIGDTLQADIPTADIYAELQEKWEVFYIQPAQASWGGDARPLDHWKGLLGQNVLPLDDPTAVCETIALQIGLCEGTIDLDDGIEDLKAAGADAKAIAAASKAVVPVGAGAAPATASDDLPEVGGGGSVDRL